MVTTPTDDTAEAGRVSAETERYLSGRWPHADESAGYRIVGANIAHASTLRRGIWTPSQEPLNWPGAAVVTVLCAALFLFVWSIT